MAVGSDTPNLLAMQRFGDPSFDLFKLSDEHNELRAVLRELCEKEVAPYAADGDEHPRSGCRRGRRFHRCRGSRAGVRIVLADPGRQQTRHDWADPPRLRRVEEA